MSARLSPAASLLRNSKLFALSPQIALPAAPPSSDVVSSSDTATTVYPQYAAIETTPVSGSAGDWGFKRPLPLKTVKTTKNPVVRLVRGIDTPEHIADFESAADHVLNLRKFQALDHPLRLPEFAQGNRNTMSSDRNNYNVFRPTHDNTTNLSSTAPANSGPSGSWPNITAEDVFKNLPPKLQQAKMVVDEERRAQNEAAGIDPKTSGIAQLMANTSRPSRVPKQQRRWRYAGPSIIQLSGMEFDDYVYNLGEKEKALLTDRIRKEIIQERLARARDQGTMDRTPREEDVTDMEVSDYLRHLRNEPRKFGPIITEILDLPEGRVPEGRGNQVKDSWEYGRDTLAAKEWQDKGPPRTHPSAGLSYLQTTANTTNHPTYGPQKNNPATLARVIKTKHTSSGTQANYGLAGFIVNKADSSTTGKASPFTPAPGGAKIIVRPGPAYVKEDGTLRMVVVPESEQDYAIRADKPVYMAGIMQEERAKLEEMGTRQQASMPMMSSGAPTYQPRAPRRFQAREEGADILDQLSRSRK